jgi:replicative superfamily II helicase
MVFVHARKETVKTALALKEAAMADGALEDFSCEEHPHWSFHRREISMSRNKELKQLFDSGFGIHHAGMLRSDRNLVERLFDAKTIKVSRTITLITRRCTHRVGPLLYSDFGLGCQFTRTCWSVCLS